MHAMFGKKHEGGRKQVKLNHDRASLIADGVLLEGDIAFRDHLYVDGSIRGNVSSISDGTVLVVGKNGSVEGNIHVGNVVVNGKVAGTLHARGDVQLAHSAVVEGDVHYGTITIEQRAVINGRLTRIDDKTGAPEAMPMRVIASADAEA